MSDRQLSLFDEPEPPGLDTSADAALMSQLGETVRMGTSSWTFPGWAGVVYAGHPSERELMQRGLAEYARHPLFRTVGIDRSYYRPLVEKDLREYSEQLPRGFRCLHKVYGRITSAVDPRTREANPDFFNVKLLEQEVLGPLERHFADHLGPLVFELMPLHQPELPSDERFIEKLGGFLRRLPRGFHYAIELRNRELLLPEYIELLHRHGVSHVFNFWERMPKLGEQLALPGLLEAGDVAVSRLMIPPGKRYMKRKETLAPFDELRDPQPGMRRDVMELVLATERLGKVVYIIANNKAEGCSPLTLRALAEELVRRAIARPAEADGGRAG
ncbi:MAG: DUF72 domain-containing protein [Polyangiaceae bacterium]|nr:DUF72 domain-containing protein [Myxococcales bacterium]MCB9588698.1 DUF72 domain-containing protein [Polyangiaceae bacterium]MCB9605256.1 DUF72 domain-containing protein [Polyangiaceae bacterium]